MNFTQMHEHLRLELLRRIQRGTLSVSLLARQTGYGQSHLSNFLHSKRQLSLEAMDRILAAQHLSIAELLPALQRTSIWTEGETRDTVPVVSHATALFEPLVRRSAVQSVLHLPASVLASVRRRGTPSRRTWQRFVAVRIASPDASAMDPLVLPEAMLLIDRHYNSLFPYRAGRSNVYAVRCVSHLTVRYVDFLSGRLVLRPHNNTFPVELVEVDPGESPSDLLTGRVALILNQT
jgi:hypothetical protein